MNILSFFGNLSFSLSTLTRLNILPFNVVFERIAMSFLTNNLDASSVNTFTLQLNALDTSAVMTITDSTPTPDMVAITGLNIPYTAGDSIGIIWESDSVGSIGIRRLAFAWRLVNPGS